ncbi:MAG: DUF4272 domain-containing protein [Sandaracinus sp.]
MLDLAPLGVALYVDRVPTARELEAALGHPVRVVGAADRPEAFEWRVGSGTMRANLSHDPQHVAVQAKGIAGYVASACTLHDPSLLPRVEKVRAILGLLVERGLPMQPALDAARGLAQGLGAFVFAQGGFFEAEGRPLATPNGAPPDTRDEDAGDEDGSPAGPPSADRVADRARVLAALAARAFAEREPREQGQPWIDDLRAWLVATGVEHELEPDERETMFSIAHGALGARAATNATWRLEGAVVLGWALSAIELPPHDRVVEVPRLARALGILQAPPPAIATPRLRSPEEIHAMRERLFSIHWRLVDWRVSPKAIDFAEVARRSTFGLVTDDAMLLDGDLAIVGSPIAKAPRDAIGMTESIARERHQAGNWLVGDQPAQRYSDVGTDT